jgi:anti-sigma regulatory factor (Ser/Thr protein kinase)
MTHPNAIPPSPEVRLSLLADPASVSAARKLVRDALTAWGYDGDVIHDSMLVMSEIVTNAVAAARGRQLRLRCTIHNRSPLLECWDPSPKLPLPRDAAPTAESGRGLAIVAAYAKDYGDRTSTHGPGKTVWALMPT